MRRMTAITAACGLVFTVWLANYLITEFGPIRVWPTDLLAPAGVYVVGVAFLLRDTVQRLQGQLLAILAIAAGAALTLLISTSLAYSSAAGFLASELVGLTVFLALGGNRRGPRGLAIAVIVASIAAAAVDSYVFLCLAFGREAASPLTWGYPSFFWGQVIAKVSVVVLALPFVLLARRRYPTEVAA